MSGLSSLYDVRVRRDGMDLPVWWGLKSEEE